MKDSIEGQGKRIIIRPWETFHLPLPLANIFPKWEVSVSVGLGEG